MFLLLPLQLFLSMHAEQPEKIQNERKKHHIEGKSGQNDTDEVVLERNKRYRFMQISLNQ